MLWCHFFNQQAPWTNPTMLATTTTQHITQRQCIFAPHHITPIPLHTNSMPETTLSTQEGWQPPNKCPWPPNNDNNTTHQTQPPQNDDQHLQKAPTTTTSTPHSPRTVNKRAMWQYNDNFFVIVIVYVDTHIQVSKPTMSIIGHLTDATPPHWSPSGRLAPPTSPVEQPLQSPIFGYL